MIDVCEQRTTGRHKRRSVGRLWAAAVGCIAISCVEQVFEPQAVSGVGALVISGGVQARAFAGETASVEIGVRDQRDREMPGVPVQFTPADAQSGQIIQAATSTNLGGMAGARWLPSPVPGEQRLRVTLNGESREFRLQVVAGRPTAVTVSRQDSVLVSVGATTTVTLSAMADRFGNAVNDSRWTNIAVSVRDTTVVRTNRTLVAGLSQPVTLTARRNGTTWVVLRPDSGTLTARDSVRITVRQVPVALSAAPVVARDYAVGDTVRVRLRLTDANAVGVPADSITVTATAGAIAGAASAMTDTGGVAFATWVLGSTPGTYRLTARGRGVLADSVTVPALLGFPSSVSRLRDSVRFASLQDTATLAFEARDRFGNVVPAPRGRLTVTSRVPGVASATTTGTVRSLANGSGWIVARADSGTASASDSSLVRVSQVTTQLSATLSGVPGTAGVGDTLTVTVIGTDAGGSRAAGDAVTFATTDGVLVDPATRTADSLGRTTMRWRLDTIPRTMRLRYTASTGRRDSVAVTANIGAPAVVTATPDTARFASLGDTARISVTARDRFGNAITLGTLSGTVAWTFAGTSAGVRGSAQTTGTFSLPVIANASGTTWLAITMGSVADTVPLVVQQVPASIDPIANVVLTGSGDSVVRSITVRDARNNRIAAAAPVISSSVTPAPAQVILTTGDTTGRSVVRAVTPGTTTITVAAGAISRTFTATVGSPGPSLAVTAATVPDTVRLGVPFSVVLQSSNAGGAATGGYRVGVYRSADSLITTADELLGTRLITDLSAGGTRTDTISGLIALSGATGAAFVGVLADDQTAVSDAVRTDNARSRAVTVGASIASFADARSVSLSGASACGMFGTVPGCWGANALGQLGDSATEPALTPVRVAASVTRISAGGAHTCGLTSGGAALCWGSNTDGQLGDNSGVNRLIPSTVSGGLVFAAISAGDAHTCGVTALGAVHCGGRNTAGQLGDGTTTNRTVPVPIAVPEPVVQVTAGTAYTCALAASGRAYCWGRNTFGQLGDSTLVDRSTPGLVRTNVVFSALDAGAHTCGVAVGSGTGFCWGQNSSGQLGDGTTAPRAFPGAVASGGPYRVIRTGDGTVTCGLRTDGRVRCWGGGIIGNGTPSAAGQSPAAITGDGLYSDVDVGTVTSCAVAVSGGTECWGANFTGLVGDGTTTERLVPTPVAQRANLVLSSLGTSSFVPRGTTLWAVSATVRNTGLAGTPVSEVAWLWRTGTNGATAAGTFKNSTLPPISAGASFVVQDTLTSTMGLNVTGFLRASANNAGGVVEARTTDNERQTAITFQNAVVTAPSSTVDLAAGTDHACMLSTDGTPFCWGSNLQDQIGQGTGASTSFTTPQRALNTIGAGFTSVAAGDRHTCAVRNSGTPQCWGDNLAGQLGDGTSTRRASPVSVITPVQLQIVESGPGAWHTCGLTSAGAAYCWGNNASGQVGDNSTVNRSSAVAVTGGLTFIQIALGAEHTCGLTSSGETWCWGSNSVSQVGLQFGTSAVAPVMVGHLPAAATISAGGNTTCIRTLTSGPAGGIYCWGANGSGQVGVGYTSISELNPGPVQSSRFATGIPAVGSTHACGMFNGTSLCWGANASGQVGTGGTSAVETSPTSAIPAPAVSSIVGGGSHTCGRGASGVVCWGRNNAGQLGRGNTLSPQTTAALVQGQADFAAGLAVVGEHACAWTSGGSGGCWGHNQYGKLGNGTLTDAAAPSAIAGLVVRSMAAGGGHSCAVATSGVVSCWGGNTVGQLGNGTLTDALTPMFVTMPSGVLFRSVAANGSHTCALATAGATYCWGLNGDGQLGDGTTTNRLVPTIVQTGVTFASVAPGVYHTCGLTAGGAAYCWGRNSSGQLGDGTTTARTTPALVAGGLQFRSISAHENSTCGVTTAGAGYCWGDNTIGKLGDGTTTSRSVPTLVSGGFTFTDISVGFAHACGTTTDGASRCWGGNSFGAFGNNTQLNSLTPVATSGGRTFRFVRAGYYHTCGLETSGQIACWGYRYSSSPLGWNLIGLTPVTVGGGAIYNVEATAGGLP